MSVAPAQNPPAEFHRPVQPGIKTIKTRAKVTLVGALINSMSEYKRRPIALLKRSDWREVVWPPMEQYIIDVVGKQADAKIRRMVLSDAEAVETGYQLLRKFATRRCDQICSNKGPWVVTVHYAAKYAGLAVPLVRAARSIGMNSKRYRRFRILSKPRRKQVELLLGFQLQCWKSTMWELCETWESREPLAEPAEKVNPPASEPAVLEQIEEAPITPVQSAALPVQHRIRAARFPNRAKWFKHQCDLRGWPSSYTVEKNDGPDHKTVDKIFQGEWVRDATLRRFVETLNTSKKAPRIDENDIPRD
jgi:hypothetical protein